MDEIRAKIEEKMRDGTIDYDFSDIKPIKNKETWWKAVLKWPFRSFMAVLGIDMKNLKGYGSSSGREVYQGPNMPPPSPQMNNSFRDNYRVVNLTNSVEFQNAINVSKVGDGRGDPPEPCHCNHDDR